MNTITIEVEGLMSDDDRMEEFLQYRPKGGHWPEGFLYRDYSIEDGHYAWASARVVEITIPLTRQANVPSDVLPFDELTHQRGRQQATWTKRGAPPWPQLIDAINEALDDDEANEGQGMEVGAVPLWYATSINWPRLLWKARLIPVEEVAA